MPRLSTISSRALWLLVIYLCAAVAMLPAAYVEAANASHVVAVGNADTVSAEFRIGTSEKVAVTFQFANGKSHTLLGAVKADTLKRTIDKDGKKTPETVSLPDGWIEFTVAGLRFQYHSRPYLKRYTEAQQADLATTWDALPAASQCWVPLEARIVAGGIELWFDGRYCGLIAGDSPLSTVSFQLAADGALRNERVFTREPSGRFLPLDVRRIARPGAMQQGRVTLKPGPQQLKNVPIIVADGASNADVGIAKEMQGPRGLEENEYTSRTALDGMPQSLHFSVPAACYQRAWVLCAVEPDEKKDPVLTTRLTRFGIWGRGGAMADTALMLPRGDQPPLGEHIERVGSVEYTHEQQAVQVPLYLVRVDLKSGEILDLIADERDSYAAMKIGPYLDFEFLGKCGGLEVQNDQRRRPVPASTSAVHIFGVTLEQSPAELRLKPTQPGNIFHNDETPETTFAIRAQLPGKYTLHWEFTDVAGHALKTGTKSVELTAGGEVDVIVPLAMPDLGWYGLQVTLADASGQRLLKHDAAFALLGRDTRRAGYESPFGTWWFSGAHYTTPDPAVSGPMLFKAGFRRTTMSWTKATEAELAPWKLSLNQIKWPFRLADLNDWPAAEARAELAISGMLKRFPHCQYINLFHESYDPRVYPPEIYGERYVPSDALLAAREDDLFQLGVKGAQFIRAKFPQLKIVAGNSGGSSGMIAVLLRRGFPRELIDYLGSEVTGQTFAPEKLVPHSTSGIWLMAETARKFGYDIPLAGCFEFTYRAERDLGSQRHAEWYAQDVLMSLAYRFPTISPAGLEDVGNCYYDKLWGAAGLCQRRPLLYPKPAYVALATQTKVFDSATLIRQISTGSKSVHALEFARGDDRIYAFWTSRGECAMDIEFPADTSLTQVEFYGRERALKSNSKRLPLTTSTAATYLISPVAATNVTAGKRRFPNHQPPPGTRIVSRMDDMTQWQLAHDPLITTELRRPGTFELRQVNDDERGACLELELKHEGDVPHVVGEYTALRLKQPVAIPGKPHTVGVWVKGDNSWGRIFWELQDAQGERWISAKDLDGGDWCNQAALDFDGWCFLTFPVVRESPARHVEPGGGIGQWQANVNNSLDYPLKLVGLYVQTHRQSLDLTCMQPVTGNIRLKDVSVIGE